jgi:hypothetical protein
MKIDVNVTSSAPDTLDELVNIDKNMEKLLKNFAMDVATFAKKNVKNGTDSRGAAFAKLKPETAKRKKNPAILNETGRSVRSIFGRSGKWFVEAGDSTGVMKFHQGNASKITTGQLPRRPIFPFKMDLSLETDGTGGKLVNDFKAKLLALGFKPSEAKTISK